MFLSLLFLLILLLAFHDVVESSSSSSSSQHTSNYAVIVSSSRYWFNYRHVVNALTIHQMLLAHGGFEEENIILMMADEYGISPRNPFMNQILHEGPQGPSLLQQQHDSDDSSSMIEIDYRGEDVTVENLRRVLTGRASSYNSSGLSLPVLQSNAQSNVLIYLTGHGGDGFFKFQDVEEILATEIAQLIAQMHNAKMYRNVLLIADTCQAYTLADAILNTTDTTTPNVTVVASSLRGESSYAHHSDAALGLSIIERYTYALSQFVKDKDLYNLTIPQAMVEPYSFAQQGAHIGYKTTRRPTSPLFMSDFFVNVQTSTQSNQKAKSSGSNAARKNDEHPFTPRLLYPISQQQQHEPRREKEADVPLAATTTATTTKSNNNNNINQLLFFGSSLSPIPVMASVPENLNDNLLLRVSHHPKPYDKGNHDDNRTKDNVETRQPLFVLGLTTVLLGGLLFVGQIMERVV